MKYIHWKFLVAPHIFLSGSAIDFYKGKWFLPKHPQYFNEDHFMCHRSNYRFQLHLLLNVAFSSYVSYQHAAWPPGKCAWPVIVCPDTCCKCYTKLCCASKIPNREGRRDRVSARFFSHYSLPSSLPPSLSLHLMNVLSTRSLPSPPSSSLVWWRKF